MRCWYTRWQMSNALDAGARTSGTSGTSGFARRHAAGCASCQAFGRALGSLHDQLSRDAHTAVAPAPVTPRARSPWLLAGPLAAGVAIAIVLAVTAGRAPPPPPGPGPIAQRVPPPVEPLRVTGLADQVTQLLADTPLDAELDNLVSDGRRGLQAVLRTGGLR